MNDTIGLNSVEPLIEIESRLIQENAMVCVPDEGAPRKGKAMLAKIIAEFRRSEQGAAMVEAAIVLPVALVILADGFEIGRGLSVHHAADKAVRNAARYLARVPAALVTDTKATQLVSAGDPNLADATVTVDATRFAAGMVSLSAVVPYNVTLLSVAFPTSTIQLTVAHEQPYVGE